MDVTPLIKADAQIIQNYDNGGFRISGKQYDTPVIVSVSSSVVWGVNSFDGLTFESFSSLLENKDNIDVVLLGCGDKIRFLPTALKAALKEQGLSVEVMDTGAACRTYNVLMAEGRRVVAALLPTLPTSK